VLIAPPESWDLREALKLKPELGLAICQGEAAEMNNGRGIWFGLRNMGWK